MVHSGAIYAAIFVIPGTSLELGDNPITRFCGINVHGYSHINTIFSQLVEWRRRGRRSGQRHQKWKEQGQFHNGMWGRVRAHVSCCVCVCVRMPAVGLHWEILCAS